MPAEYLKAGNEYRPLHTQPRLERGSLGDANIHGEWHHDVKGIYLDARIREKDIAKSHVYGYIYPIKPTSALDLQIEADSTNLKFIHHYMQSITPEFNGVPAATYISTASSRR